MRKIFLIFSLALSSTIVHGMRNIKVLAIPGQNGLGSESFYVKQCLGTNMDVTQVETPSLRPDFGQDRCIKHLREALSLVRNKKVIIHATSQGTATALNYLATEDKEKKITALVLESVLISGNDAIQHTVKSGLMGSLGPLAKIPGSYYWLPYCAKVGFPYYWPGGKQVIKSLQNISTNIPIIIIHSKNDLQLSYKGALALYYGLKANGNNNVYLISKDGSRHIQISDTHDQSIIRQILKKNGLMNNDNKQVNLQLYQPDHNQDDFKKSYNDLNNQEKWHTRLWTSIKTSAILGGIAIIGLCVKRMGWL